MESLPTGNHYGENVNAPSTSTLPRFASKKQVGALKIAAIRDPEAEEISNSDGDKILTFEARGYGPVHLNAALVERHDPQPGDYYVLDSEGYPSVSKAAEFERDFAQV